MATKHLQEAAESRVLHLWAAGDWPGELTARLSGKVTIYSFKVGELDSTDVFSSQNKLLTASTPPTPPAGRPWLLLIEKKTMQLASWFPEQQASSSCLAPPVCLAPSIPPYPPPASPWIPAPLRFLVLLNHSPHPTPPTLSSA